MTDSTRFVHRPALDGVRALAVAAVLGYHLGWNGLPGGFLGVDVFLVLSGYLITTLLLLELSERGSVQLGAFWCRRARRLLPALVVVVAATAGWALVAATPTVLDRWRVDALAALGYVANWRFVLSGQSYFDSLLSPSPFRHLWSLAIEEQFYVVWPLLLPLLWRACRRRRVVLGVIVGLAALASAAWCARLAVSGDPSRAYYGTDTRAMAILIGAVLAVVLQRRSAREPVGRPPVVARFGVPAAIGLVAVMATVDDRSMALYRGGFLAVALLATLVVAAAAEAPATALARLLGTPPLRWVGQRSYGLYLWHWPVIVALTPARTGLDGVGLALVRIAVSVGLAAVSYRFVEEPIRRRRLSAPRLGVLGGATTAATFGLVAALVTPAALVSPRLDGARLPRLTSVAPPTTVATTAAPITSSPPTTARAPTTAAPTTAPPRPLRVALFGDSTALVFGLTWRAGLAPGVDVGGWAEIGCGVAAGKPHADGVQYPDPSSECARWPDAWRSAVTQDRPDVVVVMTGAWDVLDHQIDGRVVRFGTPEWEEMVQAGIDQAVEAGAAAGTPVALMDLPCMQQSADSALPAQARNDPARVAAVNAMFAREATRPGVHLVDFASLACPGGQYAADVEGVPFRYDGVHLTDAGGAITWQWLVPQLRAMVAS